MFISSSSTISCTPGKDNAEDLDTQRLSEDDRYATCCTLADDIDILGSREL